MFRKNCETRPLAAALAPAPLRCTRSLPVLSQQKLKFHCRIVVFVPTGGPAEGDADQLPVFGGGFFFKLYPDQLELVKEPDVLIGGWGWSVVERPTEVRSREQEEGIPPPSAQTRLMRSESREHPRFPFFFLFLFFTQQPGSSAKESQRALSYGNDAQHG